MLHNYEGNSIYLNLYEEHKELLRNKTTNVKLNFPKYAAIR